MRQTGGKPHESGCHRCVPNDDVDDDDDDDGSTRDSLTEAKRVRPSFRPENESVARACACGRVVGVARAGPAPRVPAPGDVVLARVGRVAPRAAFCEIVCAAGAPVAGAFPAQIRQQDVRAAETDRVRVYDCFRPGDVVRAEVLSLGDARAYFLSTSGAGLGVVYARHGVSGQPMVPRSWEEMECPASGAREPRKVAKLDG